MWCDYWEHFINKDVPINMFYVPIEDIYKNDRNQVATNISAQEVGFFCKWEAPDWKVYERTL